MEIKMKLLIVCSLFLSSLVASANTQLQCDQIQSADGYHQRFFLNLDQYNRIVQMQDFKWKESSNVPAGRGIAFFVADSKDHALAYESEDGTYVYNYQTADNNSLEPVTDVMVVLPQALVGAATVQTTWDDTHGGFETFDVNCVQICN
jgi:hypothetical protein